MSARPECGGLGIHNFIVWNQTTIIKQLWALEFKKDRLWARWVQAYYIRGRSLLLYPVPLDISWTLRKIMGIREFVLQGGSWNQVVSNGKFSIQKPYDLLTPVRTKVLWFPLITKNKDVARCKFFVWLIARQRLTTLDRLNKWGVVQEANCKMCCKVVESHQRVFLECDWIRGLREMVFDKFEDKQVDNLL